MPNFSLIVEDGSIVAGANSYCAIADGDLYHINRLYADDWNNAAADVKGPALAMATKVIDMNVDWEGWRRMSSTTSTPQNLEWPRIYVPNNEDYYTGGLTLFYPYLGGMYYPPDKIPPRLKDAVCEMARYLIQSDRTQDYAAKGIARIGLGQGAVAIDFKTTTTDRPAVFPDSVRCLLQPFGTLRYRRTRAKIRRS